MIRLAAVHRPKEEELSTLVPSLLSSLWNFRGKLYHVKMDSWGQRDDSRFDQHFRSQHYVLLLLPYRIQARAETIDVVEEIYHADSDCTVCFLRRRLSSNNSHRELQLSEVLSVDAFYSERVYAHYVHRLLRKSL